MLLLNQYKNFESARTPPYSPTMLSLPYPLLPSKPRPTPRLTLQAEFVAGVVAKAQLLLQRAQQSAAALHVRHGGGGVEGSSQVAEQ